MVTCRGLRFQDEDDAYDYFRQREIDDAAEAEREAKAALDHPTEFSGKVYP